MLKSRGDRLCQALLFTCTCPAGGFCVVAPRAFHDQDIDFLFRKSRRFHDCLIIEINVPGVKDRFAFRSKQDSARPEHVSGVEKFECQRVFFPLRRTFA